MDQALLNALKAPPEERQFHAATIKVRHITPAERLRIIDEHGQASDYRTSLELCKAFIRVGIDGMTDDDVATLLETASDRRLQELASVVMEVNGMAATTETAAKN